VSTDALVRGIFFLLLVPFTRTLEPETETAAPRRSKANAVLSRSLPLTLFFNRSLITKTRHLYTYAHLLHSPVIYYIMINTRPRLARMCIIYIIIIIIALTHTLYIIDTRVGFLQPPPRGPLSKSDRQWIFIYIIIIFFLSIPIHVQTRLFPATRLCI